MSGAEEDNELITRLVAMARERWGADIAVLARVEVGRRIMRQLCSERPLSARPATASRSRGRCARASWTVAFPG